MLTAPHRKNRLRYTKHKHVPRTWIETLIRPKQGKTDMKMDLKEVGCWGMDWIELAQDRDRWRETVNAAMNLQVS